MPICIECHHPVSQLYHVLQNRHPKTAPSSAAVSQKASVSSLISFASSQKLNQSTPAKATPHKLISQSVIGSSDVRLMQCPRCKRFADKYVEHDYVVLFIDLVLVKPQVYRHLLFNRFAHDLPSLDPAIRRLGILLLLFDVYLAMLNVESVSHDSAHATRILTLNIFVQWGLFVFVCALANMAQHFTIRGLARLCGLCNDSKHQRTTGLEVDGLHTQLGTVLTGTSSGNPLNPPTPSAISTAIFISSCMSLFPLLMIVWKPDEALSMDITDPMTTNTASMLPAFLLRPGGGVAWVKSGVAWAVALQNIEALQILLGCGYIGAGTLVLAGTIARLSVRTMILGAVGLGGLP